MIIFVQGNFCIKEHGSLYHPKARPSAAKKYIDNVKVEKCVLKTSLLYAAFFT